jgi:hypothetical protein
MTFVFTSLPFMPVPSTFKRAAPHFLFVAFMFPAQSFIMLSPPIPFMPVPIMSIMPVKLYYSLRVIIM